MRISMIATAAMLSFLQPAMPVMAGPKGCPPGLAKKEVPCVPPGQVGKKDRNEAPKYRRGDVIRIGDFEIIREPQRYGLDRYGTFYRSGSYVFRVNGETREVLDLIGAVAAVLD